jgi:hypothetical protein
MAEQRSDDLQQSRREAALLLRLDPENLSPSDSLRCDLISALRLSIDSAQADALEGRAADLGRLIVATESLVKLLPSDPPKPEANRGDPRVEMFRIYMEMRERGEVPPEGWHQHRINELEAENERLQARLAGGPAPTPLEVPTSDITPPAEYLGVPPMRGPDDPPKREPLVIEGKAVKRPNPPAAAAPAPRPAAPAYDYNKERGWRDYVLPSGEITQTPFGGSRRWWGPV